MVWIFEIDNKKFYFSKGLENFIHNVFEGSDELLKVIQDPLLMKEKDLEYRFLTKNNEETYLTIKTRVIHDEENNPMKVVGVIQEISNQDSKKRRVMEDTIEHLLNYDELTDLPNRNNFKGKLQKKIEEAKIEKTKFALFILDIDGLKYINYLLGDEYVNGLMIEITNKLKDSLEDKVFISRYSEDHFALLIDGTGSLKEYGDYAKKIISLFKDSIIIEKYELVLGVNIGIGVFLRNSKIDMESLIKETKNSLLRAKREGKNTFRFHSPDLDVRNYKEFALRSDLNQAIEKQQLMVYYQPIVNLQNNEIVAAEALLRWEHPDWGVVSPTEFIPLAEETGKIVEIGKWVLGEVCKNYKEWQENNLPDIKVSVNFSGVQILEKDFVMKLKEIIDGYRIPPGFLIMEITESTLSKNPEKTITDIRTLKELGIEIALDDFGVGFSSITYLDSFNIDMIKIEEKFIKNLPQDRTSVAVTKAIVDLSRALDIRLIAKEIENPNQLSFLKDLKCEYGQGYIYSQPIPLKEFTKLLKLKKCKPAVFIGEKEKPKKERRKYFRVTFPNLLEADMTILRMKGKKINVGYTNVLIKNIGPGGLSFISDIKFPLEKDFLLQFISTISGEEIKVRGNFVWSRESERKLYEYGVEFLMDEKERDDLVKILNVVLVKIRKDLFFADGNFIKISPYAYFQRLIK